MKKFFALATAFVLALCAMSITAFALSYDFEDGSVGDWTTHGGQGNLSVSDGSLLTSERWNGAFKTAHALDTLTAGTTYTITLDIYADASDMDIDGAITYTVSIVKAELDGSEYVAETFTVTSGDWETVSFTFTPDADITDGYLCVNTIEHDPWGRNPSYRIDNVSLTDGAAVEVPTDEDTPVDETTADDAGVVETPADETTPAETGIALAVAPMVVAATAVVLSKRR